MKKFLKLCAVFTLVGALFAGCISNDIPDTIKQMQLAKVDLIKAQTRFIDAQTLVEAAKVQVVIAKAGLINSQSEINKQRAAILKQREEAMKIVNEFDRAVLQARITAELAYLDWLTQTYLTAIENERRATMVAHFDYLNTLMDLKVWLNANKINALDDLLNSIALLYVERADVENFIAALQAAKVVYISADVPRIKAQLDYDLEYAQFQLAYYEHMFNVWSVIKDLTVDQYLAYSADVEADMQETYQKSIDARLKADKEKINLAALKKDRDAAKDAYKYSGMNKVSFDNVFSEVADDYFRTAVGIDQGDGNTQNIFTGVVNNTYSLYAAGEMFGSKAQLGTKNTMEQLIKDSIFLQRSRIINGYEAWNKADKLLGDYLDDMEGFTEDYEDLCDLWRESYDRVKGGPDWGAEFTAYTTAYTLYKAFYGVGAANYTKAASWLNGTATRPSSASFADRNVDDDTAYNTWNAFITILQTATGMTGVTPATIATPLSMVIAALSPADVKEAFSALPVNFLYFVQKQLIKDYMDMLDNLFKGTVDEWGYATAELSPILGGIWFNSEELLNMVWGSPNTATVKKIINTIVGIAMCADLMTCINGLMPAFYEKTSAWLSEAAWGKGPAMHQYNPTTNFEHHLWFLIYYLIGGTNINISDVLIIGRNPASTATNQIYIDFLGALSANYPGMYSYLSGPSQTITSNRVAGAAVTATHRFGANLTDLYNINTWHPRSTSTTNVPVAQLTHPTVTNLITVENTLRTKYLGWGRAFEDLWHSDVDLYDPYFRMWKVRTSQSASATSKWTEAGWFYYPPPAAPAPGSNGYYANNAATPAMIPNADGVSAPIWIAHRSGNPHVTNTQTNWNISAITQTFNVDPDAGEFFFMPEKSSSPYYPSLDNGVDIYWTRGDYVPYEYLHFADPMLTPPALVGGSWDFAFYPAIAANRACLTGTQWNRWIEIGKPVYNDGWFGQNPILWDGLENKNLNSLAVVAAAFTAIRKYNQYKFWYDQNKEFDSYGELLAKITDEIATLRPIVEQLYQEWLAANQLVIYKEYEIASLEHQADMYNLLYFNLKNAFEALKSDTDVYMWGTANTFYEQAFNEYQTWKARVTVAEKNIKFFEESGIYITNTLTYTDMLGTFGPAQQFVDNIILDIDAAIQAAEDRLVLIDAEIKMYEETKASILANIISSY